MRRPFTLALACLSLATGSIALLGQGCNPGLNVQDLCGFLKEPNNCYQRFAEGVVHTTDAAGNKAKPKCGVEIIDDGSADDGKGFDVATSGPYAADNQKPTFGAFLARDKLDVCILTGGEGGQIIFDPPLEATAFPPTGFAFKMIDGTGEQCGTGSYASLTSFSLGVDPPKSTGTGTGGGGGAGGAGGTGGGETTSTDTSPITSGTFSITGTEQAEIVDTVCPDGETHKFNLYQLNKCEQYKDILPTAEVEANAGAIGKEGFVRMFVYWPPSVAGSTDGDPLANAKPVKVEYFHCKFPGPPEPCKDGVQNGSETDVDCGRDCSVQCGDGQGCIGNEDCASGVCTPNAMGIKKCVGDGCARCEMLLTDDNPNGYPVCETPSQQLFDDWTFCACDGSCAIDCGDSLCMNLVTSQTCSDCLTNSITGCGNETSACLADK